MRVKYLFWLLLVGVLGVYFLLPGCGTLSSQNCPFCNQTILENQAFYEDDLVLALSTHKPMTPGHTLVIPKRHVERFEGLTVDEMARMGEVIQKVNLAAEKVYETSSYLLLQKNGVEVGQTVPHVHFHYIPRKQGDCSVLKFLLKMGFAAVKKPISKEAQEANVQKMREAIAA